MTTTYSTPLIVPEQPLSVPSGSVVYMIEKTVTKITSSQMWLTIAQIDDYIAFLQLQLTMYGNLGMSDKQTETENTIDQWNSFKNAMQSNLDELGYQENPQPR